MKLAVHASYRPKAQKALEALKSVYDLHEPEDADVLVVLGGDGSMLRALHHHGDLSIPIYGMNLGNLGFLLNEYRTQDLPARIEQANTFEIHPLRMEATDLEGTVHHELAYNEVSLLRQTHNAAKIAVHVNEKPRLHEIICDGVLISTPMGSTAYNSSAGGPIVPLDANVLPLTPISIFRPRRWPGALLRNDSDVIFEILQAEERQVSVTADSKEIRNIVKVSVHESRSITRTLLFDPDNHLDERISKEQFLG